MNPTSRAILQSVLSSDPSMSTLERGAIQRLLDGVFETTTATAKCSDEPLLVTQKAASKLLSVSRVTVWRLTKDGVLHPVEILPGTWRYGYAEIAHLASVGVQGRQAKLRRQVTPSVAA